MDIKSVVACSVLFADTDGNITSFTQYNIIDYQILPYQLIFQLINSTDIIDLYPGVFFILKAFLKHGGISTTNAEQAVSLCVIR